MAHPYARQEGRHPPRGQHSEYPQAPFNVNDAQAPQPQTHSLRHHQNSSHAGLRPVYQPIHNCPTVHTAPVGISDCISRYGSAQPIASSDSGEPYPPHLPNMNPRPVKVRHRTGKEQEYPEGDDSGENAGNTSSSQQRSGAQPALTVHQKRKLYVGGLEGYIAESRETLRRKGVEPPKFQRSPCSNGLTPAAHEDIINNLTVQMSRLKNAATDKEMQLAETHKRKTSPKQ